MTMTLARELEKEKVFAQIWQLVQELTPSEKLSLSERLTADVRGQLLATEQKRSHFVVFSETPLHLIDDADEWSEQDLAELREASVRYLVASQTPDEAAND